IRACSDLGGRVEQRTASACGGLVALRAAASAILDRRHIALQNQVFLIPSFSLSGIIFFFPLGTHIEKNSHDCRANGRALGAVVRNRATVARAAAISSPCGKGQGSDAGRDPTERNNSQANPHENPPHTHKYCGPSKHSTAP